MRIVGYYKKKLDGNTDIQNFKNAYKKRLRSIEVDRFFLSDKKTCANCTMHNSK